MGKSLLKFPVFTSAIEKCQQALKPHGVDVMSIITSDDPTIFDNIVNCFVGIAACQVCVLKQAIILLLSFLECCGRNCKTFPQITVCECPVHVSREV